MNPGLAVDGLPTLYVPGRFFVNRPRYEAGYKYAHLLVEHDAIGHRLDKRAEKFALDDNLSGRE